MTRREMALWWQAVDRVQLRVPVGDFDQLMFMIAWASALWWALAGEDPEAPLDAKR